MDHSVSGVARVKTSGRTLGPGSRFPRSSSRPRSICLELQVKGGEAVFHFGAVERDFGQWEGCGLIDAVKVPLYPPPSALLTLSTVRSPGHVERALPGAFEALRRSWRRRCAGAAEACGAAAGGVCARRAVVHQPKQNRREPRKPKRQAKQNCSCSVGFARE